MNPKRVATSITSDLKQLGRGSRQGHRPSAQKDFGVYTPDLRGVVRDYRKQLKGESGDDLYRLGIELLAKNVTECRQVAYELIGGHAEARESLNKTRIEALGKGIDNWACVDSFCTTLVGTAWREGRLTDATIRRWARSKDLWWRRAAVVATVPLNLKAHGGSGDAERTLEICGLLADDDEEMVQKAISWALRSLVDWDRKAVVRFLADREDVLSARVIREVNTKLKTGKKNR